MATNHSYHSKKFQKTRQQISKKRAKKGQHQREKVHKQQQKNKQKKVITFSGVFALV